MCVIESTLTKLDHLKSPGFRIKDFNICAKPVRLFSFHRMGSRNYMSLDMQNIGHRL